MKLLSINVSKAIDIDYNGKQISTSIFKKPVLGKIALSELSLTGDQQSDLKNHGGSHKAIYAFSANEYDYWAKELNRSDLHYGQFGENLTISNLDETQLCIGDQLQIGNCILEITQPRVPCFKLGIALNLNTLPKQFIHHAATGIYFRIIQTGELTTKDKVDVIYTHPKQLSVQTLFKAYFDKTVSNANETMLIATSIEALSNEWRNKISHRIDQH